MWQNINGVSGRRVYGFLGFFYLLILPLFYKFELLHDDVARKVIPKRWSCRACHWSAVIGHCSLAGLQGESETASPVRSSLSYNEPFPLSAEELLSSWRRALHLSLEVRGLDRMALPPTHWQTSSRSSPSTIGKENRVLALRPAATSLFDPITPSLLIELFYFF